MSAPARSRTGLALAIAASIVVAAAVGAGIAVMGTPAQQRLALLDERRVEDLSELAQAVSHHAKTNEGRLPPDLAPLRQSEGSRLRLSDRVTGQPFAYRVVNASSFRLCATFDTDTSRVRHAGSRFCCSSRWDHPQGHHCFTYPLEDLTVD